MSHHTTIFLSGITSFVLMFPILAQEQKKLYLEPINTVIPHISTDKTIKYNYDIIYVRARRMGDQTHKRFYTDFSSPITMEPGADLMLLHPDGKEEILVRGGDGSITDPMVSFDGQWVYYSHLYNLVKASQWSPPKQGADLFKIHVSSRKIIRLTNQKYSPNTGAANWSKDFRLSEPGKSHLESGVFNMNPCPLPGGRITFTSNRDGHRPAKGYPAVALQLFVMDDRDTSIGELDDPINLDKIGHFNLSGALHPVVLKDGRIMFSTLESQGSRSDILWGIWTMNPDGTNWNPLVSAFDPGGAPNGFHFQTQLSDGSIIFEQYYNQNNSGFGSYIKMPASTSDEYPAFGPAYINDSRNVPWRQGRFDNGKPKLYRMPFMPANSISLTPFALGGEGPADRSIIKDKNSPAVGKVTHPSGAPNNNLLTVYSPGPVNHQYTYLPQLDGGIYLLKNGEIAEEPAQLLLIKNDPNYNESWPRALVPYEQIYGIKEPKHILPQPNNGKASVHLPQGTPFALVGTSSFYKRETYPNGVVPSDKVTSTYAGGNDRWKGLDQFTSHGNGAPINWHNQGSDAGLYSNQDIHAVRILIMEPTTERKGSDSGRRFYSHARERLRILGEIPLRHFKEGKEEIDPDKNPDTSFLAKIPADTAFTFQTLDKNGLLLNAAQTWHQLRPGEIRNDCGGCHAHSQKPTDFKLTAASKPDYKVWDLVNSTPLLTEKAKDQSKIQWDKNNDAGLRFLNKGPLNVEYHRNIRPILARSCIACHTNKNGKEPAAKLNLDADDELVAIENLGKMPGTYVRLAVDERAQFGHKPVGWDSWGSMNASRYVRKFQARRSLLTWKIFGERLDGFHNDDHPSETKPGVQSLTWKGEQVDIQKFRAAQDLDYLPSQMPPPDAVKSGKVVALSEEDKRTVLRWIDLGCPIDLDYDALQPNRLGFGWMLDDNRPILTIAEPRPGNQKSLSRILIGMHDYYTGLDLKTLNITANITIAGFNPGENLATQFKLTTQGVWEFPLPQPITNVTNAKLTVSIRDIQGNTNSLERTFTIHK